MEKLVEDHCDDLARLCDAFGVARLEIFGSAATEAFDADASDLDFLVEFRSTTDLGPWLKRFHEFRAALADLFDRPVDLVMSSAMRNPSFIREVNRTRQVLYAA